jgi:hypothetical protein
MLTAQFDVLLPLIKETVYDQHQMFVYTAIG